MEYHRRHAGERRRFSCRCSRPPNMGRPSVSSSLSLAPRLPRALRPVRLSSSVWAPSFLVGLLRIERPLMPAEMSSQRLTTHLSSAEHIGGQLHVWLLGRWFIRYRFRLLWRSRCRNRRQFYGWSGARLPPHSRLLFRLGFRFADGGHFSARAAWAHVIFTSQGSLAVTSESSLEGRSESGAASRRSISLRLLALSRPAVQLPRWPLRASAATSATTGTGVSSSAAAGAVDVSAEERVGGAGGCVVITRILPVSPAADGRSGAGAALAAFWEEGPHPLETA